MPAAALAVLLAVPPSSAQVETQIVRDGSLGSASVPLEIQPDGTIYEIGEDHGARAGANLFHSFLTFDLGAGDTALFTAEPTLATRNVISRVTGGDASHIHGTLASDIEGADLYFLNPSGILFGADAALDVKGSFYASTADYLAFGESRFETGVASDLPALAVPNPTAFGFLSSAPAPIQLDGSRIEVPEGRVLALVGGDLRVAGRGPEVYGEVVELRISIPALRTLEELLDDPSALELLRDPDNRVLVEQNELLLTSVFEFPVIRDFLLTPAVGDLVVADALLATRVLMLFPTLTPENAAAKLEALDPSLAPLAEDPGFQGLLLIDPAERMITLTPFMQALVVLQARETILSELALSELLADPFPLAAGVLGDPLASTLLDPAFEGVLADPTLRAVLEQPEQIPEVLSGAQGGGSMVAEFLLNASDTEALDPLQLEDPGPLVPPTLRAPGGRIHLASLASAGEIPLEPTAESIAAAAPAAQLGDLQLGDGAILDVSGDTAGAIHLSGGTTAIVGSILDSRSAAGEGGNEISILGTESLELSGSVQNGALVSEIEVDDLGPLPVAPGGIVVPGRDAIPRDPLVRAEAPAGSRGPSIRLEGGEVAISTGRIETRGSREVPGIGVSIIAENVRLENQATVVSTATGPVSGGDISIAASASITLSGANRDTQANDSLTRWNFLETNVEGESGARSGSIWLDAPVVRLEDGASLATEPALGPQSVPIGRSGEIGIRASESVTIEGVDPGEREIDRLGSTLSTAASETGSISIDAPVIAIRDGALLTTRSESGLLPGGIALTASENVTLSGTRGDGLGTRLAAEPGGAIEIEAPDILLQDGARLEADSFAGTGGTVTLVATERVRIEGSDENFVPQPSSIDVFGVQEGGTIRIEAPLIELVGASVGAPSLLTLEEPVRAGSIEIFAGDRLLVAEDALITTSTLDNPGDAGLILIEAGSMQVFDSSIRSASESRGPPTDTGDAGTIEIRVDGDLELRNARVASTTDSIRDPDIGTPGAGAIRIQARRLDQSGGSIATSSSGTIDAGSIEIDVDVLSMWGDAEIASLSTGSGNAGSIEIGPDARSVVLSRSTIATSAVDSDGGDISISVSRWLSLEDGSTLTANVAGGDGGSVTIGTPKAVALRDRSAILANAAAEGGRGGRIEIATEAFARSVDSVLDASAPGGPEVQGEIEIRGPEVALEGTLTPLVVNFLDAAAMLRPSCAARGSASGSFSVARRSGLAASPEGLLLAFDASGDGGIPQLARDTRGARPPGTEPEEPTRSAMARGTIAFRGGRFEEAAAHWGEASQAFAASGEAASRGDALRGVAQSQQALGRYADSLAPLRQALALAQESGDAGRIAAALGGLADAHLALGQGEEAEELFVQAVALARQADRRDLAAGILNNLGNSYAAQGRLEKAFAVYEESAKLAAEAGATLAEAKALANATRAALDAGRIEQAMAPLERAEALARSLPEGHEKAYVLIHLSRSYEQLAQADPERRVQGLLHAHANLSAAVQTAMEVGDERALSYALGNLGALYERENRFEEALYLTRRAQGAAERAEAPQSLYRWHWQEGRLLWAQGRTDASVRAYRRAVSVLEETRQETLTRFGSAEVYFRRAVAPVYLDLADALLRGSTLVDDRAVSQDLLAEARATVEQLKAAELRDYFRDECVAEIEARTQPLDRIAAGAAVVYPILLPERLELLVSLPSGLERHIVPITAERVAAEVAAFRLGLMSQTGFEYRPHAETLYDWLVRPYAERLEAEGVETLVFVPGGALRMIPMAALHDGAGFLVSRYAVAVTPGLSLVDPKPLHLERARLLLAGLSESTQGFPQIPNAARELATIHELYGGEVLLDEAFETKRFKAELATAQPSVVHVASHAMFTGDPETSFLLTHDSRLTMDELSEAVAPTQFQARPLELLALSGCETAAGDERAALGLAGMAIRAGARSALGSLWRIQDEATYELVVGFYEELREPAVSKAEALRRAQLRLLKGGRFVHPFYWSPFLLISNWL